MSEPEYKLDPNTTERDLLFRMVRELTTIRTMMVQVIGYIRDAESEIPEKTRRFMNYMHDLHDIKYMYEELGHTVPTHQLREMERCDDRFRQMMEEMNAPGGAFEKIRRKMADDPNNRWDHTKLLTTKLKEKSNDSTPVQNNVNGPEAGAEE